MKRFLKIGLSVIIPILLLLMVTEWNALNQEFYTDFQLKNGVTEVTKKGLGELQIVTGDLIEYLKSGDSQIISAHFNQKEVVHMADVYGLFTAGRFIRNILLAATLLLLFYAWKEKWLAEVIQGTFYGIFLTLAVLVIVGIILTSTFSESFLLFHHLFFDNDLWLLDPRTDLLIQLLPEEFFKQMVQRILAEFLFILAIFQLLGFVFLHKTKKEL